MTSSVTRREFVETTTGLVIAFALPWRANAPPGTSAAPFTPNAWVRIGTDGLVTLTLDRSEMGQGSQTGLAMILAEELEADWTSVRLGPMPENPAGWSRTMRTGGSAAIRSSWEPLRKAGAAAREMLIDAAASTWRVDRAACRAERGAVVHGPSKRRIAYGKLVAKAAQLPVPNDPPLKDPKDFRLVGTRTGRLDTPAKVDGTAQFGIDVKVPGMLVAVVARCPVFGGKVASFDATKAQAVPGVRRVVPISSGVAVLADGYWPARQGRDALEVKWDEGPNAGLTSASISQLLAQRAEQPGVVARHDGDPAAALGTAALRVEAPYELPFLAHATMEPMNCTAHVRPDGVDLWAATTFRTGAP